MEITAKLRSVSPGPVFWFDVEGGSTFKWDVTWTQSGWFVKQVATGAWVTIHSREWEDVVAACVKAAHGHSVARAMLQADLLDILLTVEYGPAPR